VGGGEHLLKGSEPGSDAVMVNNNDYLHMVGRPSIIEAQTQALASADSGVMMSGVYFREGNAQSALERRLAEYTGYGAAMLSQSGYTANVGLIQALAGPEVPIYKYIKYEAFPSIFSSALLPVDIAGLAATLEEVVRADWEREVLCRHARRIREGLLALGYNVTASNSQIVAIESGSEIATIKLRNALEREGVFGAPFCTPAAQKNRAMVRLSVTGSLSDLQVERII